MMSGMRRRLLGWGSRRCRPLCAAIPLRLLWPRLLSLTVLVAAILCGERVNNRVAVCAHTPSPSPSAHSKRTSSGP